MSTSHARSPSNTAPRGSRGHWARNPYVWVVLGACVVTLGVVALRELLLREHPQPLLGRAVAAQGQPSGRAPSTLLELPALELVDQDRRPFTLASFAGRVHIVNFFFTSCPSICPRLMNHMAALQKRTAGGDPRLGLVSITVDPATDTPARLRANGEKYGADFKRWTFLTGPIPAIEKAVQEGFKQVMDRQPTPVKNAAGEDVYDITHGAKLVLVDQAGGIRGYYDIDEAGTEELLRDAALVLRETGTRDNAP